jgi:hypothetical protein
LSTHTVTGLREFLVIAKRHTYAAGVSARTLPDGSKELTYTQGPWHYQDRYVGFATFAGQEIVRYESAPHWTMGYYGGISTDPSLPDEASATTIYIFLQAALREIPPTHPFRGPHTFSDDDYAYRNAYHGDIARFTGIETLLHRDREVYRLDYHGGYVR